MTDFIHVNDPYVRGEADSAQNWRGERHLSSAEPFSGSIMPRSASGDITGNAAYALPGQPALLNGNGVWGAFTPLSPSYNGFPMQNPDGYIYRDTLLYRSDTTPRRDSPNYRMPPSSPTTPNDRYRFLDGRRGDTYG
jgi:hypothetical protein